MQFIYTKGIEGENPLYFGKWKGKDLEKFSKTQSWMNWDLKEVWHRQDGRKRNKEYSRNKPSLFLDFWKVLKYSPQFQRPSFYDQASMTSFIKPLFPKKKQKQKSILAWNAFGYTHHKTIIQAGLHNRGKSIFHEQISGRVGSGHGLITEWSHWWLRVFFVYSFCLFYSGLRQRLDLLLLATIAISGNPTDMLTYSHFRRESENLFSNLWCARIGFSWPLRSDCQIFRNFATGC